MTSTTSTTAPKPQLTGHPAAGGLAAQLDQLAGWSKQAGAPLPAPITDAWAEADAWAVTVLEATAPRPGAIDLLLDTPDHYAAPDVQAALLATLVDPQTRVDRVRTRTADRRWQALWEHRDALLDAWAHVVDDANGTLRHAADLLSVDNLADVNTFAALGGTAAGAWGNANQAASTLNVLRRAYLGLAGLLAQPTTIPGLQSPPLWLAPLDADDLEAWENRPAALRSMGGGTPIWAGPWFLARRGIDLKLANLDDGLLGRVTAAERVLTERIARARAERAALENGTPRGAGATA